MTVKFTALKQIAQGLDGKKYPMFIGFLSPVEILRISEVPSFPREKEHHLIAKQLEDPPITDWQRPLDEVKMGQIADIYSTADSQIMANPVILANSSATTAESSVRMAQRVEEIQGGGRRVVEGLWDFEVRVSAARPLWILDGQHRAEGLAVSRQRDTPIPFVLLWDPSVYLPRKLAKMFTLVTSKAEPMQEVHAAWMHYSFKMEDYAREDAHDAMETVLHLCGEQSLDEDRGNRFFNRITFNPYRPAKPFGGFKFDAVRFAQLIRENYYSKGPANALRPLDLARELFRATEALYTLDSFRDAVGEDSSRLFSMDEKHASELLADGFVYGLLNSLANESPTKSPRDGVYRVRSIDEWVEWLSTKERRFHDCDWRLRFARGKELGGNFSAPSREVARQCFLAGFSGLCRDHSITALMEGSGMRIRLRVRHHNPDTDRAIKRNEHVAEIVVQGGVPIECDLARDSTSGPRRFLRLEPVPPNCQIYSVSDPSTQQALKSEITRGAGLDLKEYRSGQVLNVTCIAFSSGATRNFTIRIEK